MERGADPAGRPLPGLPRRRAAPPRPRRRALARRVPLRQRRAPATPGRVPGAGGAPRRRRRVRARHGHAPGDRARDVVRPARRGPRLRRRGGRCSSSRWWRSISCSSSSTSRSRRWAARAAPGRAGHGGCDLPHDMAGDALGGPSVAGLALRATAPPLIMIADGCDGAAATTTSEEKKLHAHQCAGVRSAGAHRPGLEGAARPRLHRRRGRRPRQRPRGLPEAGENAFDAYLQMPAYFAIEGRPHWSGCTTSTPRACWPASRR